MDALKGVRCSIKRFPLEITNNNIILKNLSRFLGFCRFGRLHKCEGFRFKDSVDTKRTKEMTKEDKQYDIDIITAKGIFLQKKDCLDNGSDKVLEIIKRGTWEHTPDKQIKYVGWKVIIRAKDDLYQFSHRRVAEAKVVRVDDNSEGFNITITRLNGKNR